MQLCLDLSRWYYGEYHNTDSPRTKEDFKKLWGKLDSLLIKDSDAVVGEIGCLCAEYERIAFTAGLKLMAQLMMKLTENATREWEIKAAAHGGDMGLDQGRFYDYVIA